MTREQLIREMIQIELLYQTRQKILKETSTNNQNPSDPSSQTSTQQPQSGQQPQSAVSSSNSNSQNNTNTPPVPPTPTATFSFDILFSSADKSSLIDNNKLYTLITKSSSHHNLKLNDDFKTSLEEFYTRKGLKQSQINSIIADIASHIIGDNKTTVSGNEAQDYCQSLIDFPFNKLSYNKTNILDDLCEVLNKPAFIQYLNKTSFHSDIYNNISKPDHPMGPGKGEFLTLSLISNAKSGGSKEHDIIFYDSSNNEKTSELEVKQGQSKADDFKFNVNIKRDSKSSQARAKFLKSLNDFYGKFIKSTQRIDNLLDVTGIYESEYIKKNFIHKENKNKVVNFKDLSAELLNYYDSSLKEGETDADEDADASDNAYESETKYTQKNQKFKLAAILAFLNDNSQQIPTGKSVKILNRNNSTQAKNILSLDNITRDILQNRGQTFKDLKNYQIIFDYENPNDTTSLPKISITNEVSKDGEGSNAYTDLEEIFQLIKGKVDAESPFKNLTTKNSATASSLNLWVNHYFDFIIKKYSNLLQFYKNMLVGIKNSINKTSQNQPDQTVLQDVLSQFKPKDLEDANWTNWNLFLQIYRGLDIGNKEVAIEFKYYDENGNLVKSKNIVNVVNDEFKIVKPYSRGLTNINDFFNKNPDNEDVNLQIRNEDISDNEFENIMSTKETFRFLKTLTASTNSKTTTNSNSASNTNNVNNNLNTDNRGVLDLLNEAIQSLIELHTTLYQEYTEGEGNVSAEGILYVATNSQKKVSKFMKPFYKKGIDYNVLDDISKLKNFAKTLKIDKTTGSPSIKPEVPLIKDIYPNEKVLWCNYIHDSSEDSISLLTVLLKLKDNLQNTYITSILNEIGQIKNEIDEIKLKTRKIKLSQVNQIKNPKQRFS